MGDTFGTRDKFTKSFSQIILDVLARRPPETTSTSFKVVSMEVGVTVAPTALTLARAVQAPTEGM